MVIRNKMSRFDLAILALKNIPDYESKYIDIIAKLEEKISDNKVYVKTNLKDMDEIEYWTL